MGPMVAGSGDRRRPRVGPRSSGRGTAAGPEVAQEPGPGDRRRPRRRPGARGRVTAARPEDAQEPGAE